MVISDRLSSLGVGAHACHMSFGCKRRHMAQTYVVMLPTDPRFGKGVPPEITDDDELFVSLGDFGQACIEGDVSVCMLVTEGTPEQAKKELVDECMDVRLLDDGERKDRRSDLSSVLPHLKEPPFEWTGPTSHVQGVPTVCC
eukprot:5663460-Amphidinium_carterae.1